MKPSERFVDGLSMSEVAALFNLSMPLVSKILYGLTPDGNSDGKSKRYMGNTVLQGLKNYYGARGKSSETTLEQERIRLTAAQANRAEMELAISRGELLPVDDVINEMAMALSEIKATCINLPARIAPAVFNQKTSRDVETVAKGIITDALDRLQADIALIPSRVSGHEATADPDDQRVGADRTEAVG